MGKQDLSSAIVSYNRKTSEAIGAIQRSLKDLEEFRSTFADQRMLIARLDMAKRTLIAAANNLENLRPRIFMIEENEPPKRIARKTVSRKTNNPSGVNKKK